MRAASVLLVLALATPATAVTVTSAPLAPDPRLAPREKVVVDFDSPSAAGIVEISWGGEVLTGSGSTGGVRAAPVGNATAYRSLGSGASTMFDFTDWNQGRALASLSFDWGSVDSYNFVDFFNSRNELVATIGGGNLPMPDGNWFSDLSNRRVFVDFARGDDVRSAVFRSDNAAFEFDTLAAAAVPEPSNWALLIAGFGFVGLAQRRHRKDPRVNA